MSTFSASPTLPLENGSLALHSAANADKDDQCLGEIIATLLSHPDVDVNAQNYDGRTPLRWAAEKGNAVAIKAFIENGARTDLKGKSAGITAADMARMKMEQELGTALGKEWSDKEKGEVHVERIMEDVRKKKLEVFPKSKKGLDKRWEVLELLMKAEGK